MELSDEEKEAIEILKKLQKKTPYIIWGDGTPYNKSNQIQTILNLIEKQQKEIEEKTTIIMAGAEKVKQLEKEIEVLTLDLEEMTKTYNHMKENWVHKLALNSYIRKDKIRETFQFYIERDSLFNDNPHKMAVIRLKDVLKELLEEK
jgi:hypothetical protein